MFGIRRILKEKDINSTNLGKFRTYRLVRSERTISFKGKLLGYYHASGDSLEPAAQNQTHLESIAIFKTSTRYLVWYVLEYLNNEHLSGRKVHVHAAPSLDAVARFIDSMTYVNKKSFAQAVVEDARAQDS